MRALYIFVTGRSKANNVEPYFSSLLNTLNEIWDTAKYNKTMSPVIEAIDFNESTNQIKSKTYTY